MESSIGDMGGQFHWEITLGKTITLEKMGEGTDRQAGNLN
jgi:hypothetical protein